MSDFDPSKRSTPPEKPEEHQYIWEGARKAHEAWPVNKVLVAMFGNWKVLVICGLIGALLGWESITEFARAAR